MRRMIFGCFLTAVAFSGGGGCAQPGGVMWSIDQFTYESHEWQPWTVSLIDTRTGESLWSVDVPVGQKLTVGFRKGAGPNEFKPDMMDWGIVPSTRSGTSRPNQLPVPPAQSRRLEPTLRPTPELPGTAPVGSPFETTTGSPTGDDLDPNAKQGTRK